MNYCARLPSLFSSDPSDSSSECDSPDVLLQIDISHLGAESQSSERGELVLTGMVRGGGCCGALDNWFSEKPLIITEAPGSLHPWSSNVCSIKPASHLAARDQKGHLCLKVFLPLGRPQKPMSIK